MVEASLVGEKEQEQYYHVSCTVCYGGDQETFDHWFMLSASQVNKH